MKIYNRFYRVNVKGLNNINQEELDLYYLKNKEIFERKKQYEQWLLLLQQNKKIKGTNRKQQRLTYKQIEELTGISKRTYSRIKKELKLKGTTYWKEEERKKRDNNNNIKRNTRPNNLRQSKISLEYKETILKVRLENPTYSKDKIKRILERDYNNNNNIIDISSSSIGRVLKQLHQEELITLKGSKLNKKLKPNEINNTKPRNFKDTHSKQWNYEKHNITNTKYNNKISMGELIQIDHLKYHNSKIGLKFVEFSAVDPITRIKTSYCYSTATSKNARDFLLNHLIPSLPFGVKSIQVDGGSEFRKYFEETCKELKIPLFVLPPYSPKYNGRIERSNRTIREEFYNSTNNKLIDTCTTREDYNELLREYIHKYNHYRPHQALDYLTPMEYYHKLMEERKICARCV
jgi:transposase InsO family protein